MVHVQAWRKRFFQGADEEVICGGPRDGGARDEVPPEFGCSVVRS